MDGQWITEALATVLQRSGREGLAHQLTRRLRQWITDGQLPAGQRLPASRDLARSLRLGRNTVLDAYEQLQAEGYLTTRPGAGTYVCQLFTAEPPRAAAPTRPARLSARGQALFAHCRDDEETGAFVPCIPDVQAFPHQQWQRLLGQHQRRAPRQDLNYQYEGGLPALRQALADYLRLSRAVRCDPDRILITQGTQQSLALCAQLLADAGDPVWTEEPGYPGARAAFYSAGLDLVPAPVDEQGLAPDRVADPRPPRLIYTTPSYQYPCGVTMPLSRRLALLARAERDNAWIIEDDYDSEFRYASQPLPAMQGLSRDERVIYLGTMSKVMYPGLRLGYLVVPEPLVDAFRAAGARLYPEGHYPLQAALADFIGQGGFARHVRRMRELYFSRQQALRAALSGSAAEICTLSPGGAGMHLTAWLPPGYDDNALSREAARRRIWLSTLSRHYAGPARQPGLVLGYAAVGEAEIRRGVEVIAALMADRR